jgi:hypothetical protein
VRRHATQDVVTMPRTQRQPTRSSEDSDTKHEPSTRLVRSDPSNSATIDGPIDGGRET